MYILVCAYHVPSNTHSCTCASTIYTSTHTYIIYTQVQASIQTPQAPPSCRVEFLKDIWSMAAAMPYLLSQDNGRIWATTAIMQISTIIMLFLGLSDLKVPNMQTPPNNWLDFIILSTTQRHHKYPERFQVAHVGLFLGTDAASESYKQNTSAAI